MEALLNTQYHNYQHKQSGGFRVACDEYGLPQHVRPHVDFIMPTIQLDGLQPVAQTIRHEAVASGDANLNLTDLSHCGKLVTINCLRELYKIPAGKYNHTGNKLGIAEWADYLYLPDLPKFFELLTTPKIPADTVPEFVSIDRGKESSLARAKAQQVVESALDFQTAYSIIWPQQTRLYQVGDGVNVDSVGTFNIFLDALVGPPPLQRLGLLHQSLTCPRMRRTARTKAETSPTSTQLTPTLTTADTRARSSAVGRPRVM